tara:strand:+ start:324 stop:1643 length:1320 start_codon:yes stop_codon:yes gene_type:complete
MQFMNKIESVFVLGIGGSGMSSIAKYLAQKKMKVEGYDQRKSYITNQLEQDGVKVIFDIDNFVYSPKTLYVYSSAIPINDTFLKNNLESSNVLSRAQFLKQLSEENKIIGITGTHGKTSTTALIAHIFHHNNIDVSYIFGGSTSFHGIGGHYGKKDLPIILEVDEAYNTFKDIKLEDLLVTNIDEDHLDYFETFENLIDAFRKVILNVNNNLVLNYDDQNINQLMIKNKHTVYSSIDGSEYKINYPNKFINNGIEYEIVSNLIGSHFVSNITGAIAIASLNGIEINDSLEAIKSFPGVNRRTEYLGSVKGIKLYDDYGHHPTEIKATISALKQITKGQLYVIFQPHRYSRTKENFEKFREELNRADFSIVVDIYPAGEKPIPGVTSKNFESENIKYLKSIRLIPPYLLSRVKENDIVLTLGAGDITLLGPQILKYLDEK